MSNLIGVNGCYTLPKLAALTSVTELTGWINVSTKAPDGVSGNPDDMMSQSDC